MAEYWQKQFPGWDVDCEYNRKGIETKKLKDIEERDDLKKSDIVFPDIIVHQRNTTNNLLVIELKKNDRKSHCDIKKLELFTRDNDYAYYRVISSIHQFSTRVKMV